MNVAQRIFSVIIGCLFKVAPTINASRDWKITETSAWLVNPSAIRTDYPQNKINFMCLSLRVPPIVYLKSLRDFYESYHFSYKGHNTMFCYNSLSVYRYVTKYTK
jgi:hypothetical protein